MLRKLLIGIITALICLITIFIVTYIFISHISKKPPTKDKDNTETCCVLEMNIKKNNIFGCYFLYLLAILSATHLGTYLEISTPNSNNSLIPEEDTTCNLVVGIKITVSMS